MNALVKKVLRKSLPRGGPNLALLDAIFELQQLADSATAKTQAEELSAAVALDLPVEVGGVKLWRLSIAACDWMEQIERDWFPRDARMMETAVVWACAHGRDKGAFAGLGGRTATAFKLGFWARQQRASWEALTATVKALLPRKSAAEPVGEPAPVDDDAGGYLGAVLETLLANYGQTVEYWLWEVPQETVMALLDVAGARADAESDGAAVGARQIAAHKRFVEAAKAFDAKWGAHG